MPEGFTKCIKEGGKVKTVSLPNGKYLHICKDMNGKWHRGEMKIKEKKGKK